MLMRLPIFAVVLAGGIHCSAPAEPPSEVVAAPEHGEESVPRVRFSGPRETPTRRMELSRLNAPEWHDITSSSPRGLRDPLARDATMITSTVRGDDGTLYTAGTFTGTMTFGTTTVASRGREDAFVARIESDGGRLTPEPPRWHGPRGGSCASAASSRGGTRSGR